MIRYQSLVRLAMSVALALTVAISSHAFTFVEDGIYYDVNGDAAIVTSDGFNSYTGQVVIPSTVTHLNKTYNVAAIAADAFRNSVGLTAVTLPNTITSIGANAFDGCEWLTAINIPASVNSIGSRVFANCPTLTTITVASGNTTYNSQGNCNAIIETSTNRLIAGCLGTTIPAMVTTIGEYAFDGCVKLTSISIPNSVTQIGQYAFNSCVTLSNLTLGSGVRLIDDYAFNDCSKIASLILPNLLDTIGNAAFMGCTALTAVNIPASASQIGGWAFAECPNIESMQVASGNSTYDSRDNCNGIIEKSSNILIAGCKNTVIPGTIRAIGGVAFYGCSQMTTCSIPASVREIGSDAFGGCRALKDLYMHVTHLSEFSYGSSLFYEVPVSTCVLHVPYNALEVYKSLSQWQDFTHIVEMANAADVTGDNDVDISDVNLIINIMLGKHPYDSKADVNGDGMVDITDINLVINAILGRDESPMNEYLYYRMNEIYQLMHTAGWSTTGNTHQCFGISAYNLMAEVMGDDMLMGRSGSGWFWYDAVYNVKSRYTSNSWRSYDLWNAYYTWIANANEVLSRANTLSNTKYIRGQAYAIRAYAYFMLAQSFARTYKGHESEPCVPLYTGTTFNSSTGQARATVQQVYAQIDSDLSQAVTLLQGTAQKNTEHMGLAVAQGIRARVALVKEDWSTALSASQAAIEASGKTILEVSQFIGMNDATAGNVMWGTQIAENEVGRYASFFAHMDTVVAYGQGAPKMITKSLYNRIPATDARKAWWDPYSNYTLEYNGGVQQKKFMFSDPAQWMGDYVWMRVEEMYLIAAEAACRLGNAATAKTYLMNLMSKRDPNYTCTKTGTSLGALTSDATGSLLEEIITQRRIELWGEAGRVYDIRRLKQGFVRNAADGWASNAVLSGRPTTNPENYMWVLTIPQAEFDGNPNLNIETDQNPIGDE